MAKLIDGRSGSIAKALPPAKGQRLVFDEHRDAPRGFALRVTAAGGKAFILRYHIDGRERRKTIGAWPTWSLEAARDEARKLLVEIERGNDPLEEKRRRRNEPTVAELADEWVEKYATGLTSERAIRGYMVNHIMPAIGRIKVTDVRRRDAIRIVEHLAETRPRAAAQTLLYARRLFDYAANRDIIPGNPLAGLKPSAITVKGRRDPLRPTVRGRVLDADEMRVFWHQAEKASLNRLTVLALKLVLVTGQRPGEVAGLHEREVNGRLWTIPAARRGKTGTPHSVHLTDLAVRLLDEARSELARVSKRRGGQLSGHLFETRPGSPIMSTALARAVDREHVALGAKIDPQWGRWTPHDLRRTMRTGLSACRVRPDIAEMVIGHTKKGIIATYDQHTFEAEQRAALEAWEARLCAILENRDPDAEHSNVVQLVAKP